MLRSPHVNKDSREQFEVRLHQRLIDIKDLSSQTIDKLMSLDLPAGVDVEVRLCLCLNTPPTCLACSGCACSLAGVGVIQNVWLPPPCCQRLCWLLLATEHVARESAHATSRWERRACFMHASVVRSHAKCVLLPCAAVQVKL